MEEVWVQVTGYEGLYEISNTEKIRSLDICTWCGFSGSGKHHITKGRLLKITPFKATGKPSVTLYKDGKRKRYFFSVLVAKSFPEICGEWFEGCEVHHIDRNPLNNTPNNLLVVSQDEHKQIHREDLIKRMSGSNNPFYGKKHNEELLKQIAKHNHEKPIIQYTAEGQYIKQWDSSAIASKTLGISKNAINNVLKGRAHTCSGKDGIKYKFSYLNPLLQYRQLSIPRFHILPQQVLS